MHRDFYRSPSRARGDDARRCGVLGRACRLESSLAVRGTPSESGRETPTLPARPASARRASNRSRASREIARDHRGDRRLVLVRAFRVRARASIAREGWSCRRYRRPRWRRASRARLARGRADASTSRARAMGDVVRSFTAPMGPVDAGEAMERRKMSTRGKGWTGTARGTRSRETLSVTTRRCPTITWRRGFRVKGTHRLASRPLSTAFDAMHRETKD